MWVVVVTRKASRARVYGPFASEEVADAWRNDFLFYRGDTTAIVKILEWRDVAW